MEFGCAPLDPPLIEALSLEMRTGARVALVGSSGSGKSTVGKLIAGLEQPRAGTILIDGRSAIDWPRDALAARLAYVRQGVMLFEGTIRENLTLWNPGVPEPEMIRVEKRLPSATVTALEPVQVLGVPREALLAAFAKDTGFAARFYHALAVFLSDRLRSATADAGADDELDEGLLDTLHQAGYRFVRLLNLLSGREH